MLGKLKCPGGVLNVRIPTKYGNCVLWLITKLIKRWTIVWGAADIFKIHKRDREPEILRDDPEFSHKHCSQYSFFGLDLPQSIFRTFLSLCLKLRSGTGNSETNLISMWPYTEPLCHCCIIPSDHRFKRHCIVYRGSCLTEYGIAKKQAFAMCMCGCPSVFLLYVSVIWSIHHRVSEKPQMVARRLVYSVWTTRTLRRRRSLRDRFGSEKQQHLHMLAFRGFFSLMNVLKGKCLPD